MLAGCFDEIRWIGRALHGAEPFVKQLADLLLHDVDGRRHNVARMFMAKLDDPLAEIGVGNLDAAFFQMWIEATLFGEHRFAFYNSRYAMTREDAGDDRVVLSRVASPVDLGAQLCGGGFELLEIFVEPRHGVELGSRCYVAQHFPLGDRLRGPI